MEKAIQINSQLCIEIRESIENWIPSDNNIDNIDISKMSDDEINYYFLPFLKIARKIVKPLIRMYPAENRKELNHIIKPKYGVPITKDADEKLKYIFYYLFLIDTFTPYDEEVRTILDDLLFFKFSLIFHIKDLRFLINEARS